MLPVYLMIFGSFGVAMVFVLPIILDDVRRHRSENACRKRMQESDLFISEMALGVKG